MAEATPSGPKAAATPAQDDSPTSVVARRGLRDLAALLALPAMWVDQDPADIASALLGVLFSLLGLKSAYVRFDDPAGGPSLERWRPDGPRLPFELESSRSLTRARGTFTTSVATPSGDGVVRVTGLFPALPGEDGLVLVCSGRPDFPTDPELHLLRVAIGQATISIHSARRLTTERAARVLAEAALSRRNAFLTTLGQELEMSLAVLAQRAAQAQSLAAEQDGPMVSAVVGVTGDAHDGASRHQAGVPLVGSASRLTRREAEVLGLLAQGLSNKEIAGIMWLSDRTVERHITGLYRKIGVDRRGEATAFAVRHGLVGVER